MKTWPNAEQKKAKPSSESGSEPSAEIAPRTNWASSAEMKPNDSPIVAAILTSTSATVSSSIFSPLKLPESSEAVLPSDEEELQAIAKVKAKPSFESESEPDFTGKMPKIIDSFLVCLWPSRT